jgi:hypothetical protein
MDAVGSKRAALLGFRGRTDVRARGGLRANRGTDHEWDRSPATNGRKTIRTGEPRTAANVAEEIRQWGGAGRRFPHSRRWRATSASARARCCARRQSEHGARAEHQLRSTRHVLGSICVPTPSFTKQGPRDPGRLSRYMAERSRRTADRDRFDDHARLSPTRPGSRSARVPDRRARRNRRGPRVKTVMFSDVMGSTELAKLGDAVARSKRSIARTGDLSRRRSTRPAVNMPPRRAGARFVAPASTQSSEAAGALGASRPAYRRVRDQRREIANIAVHRSRRRSRLQTPSSFHNSEGSRRRLGSRVPGISLHGLKGISDRGTFTQWARRLSGAPLACSGSSGRIRSIGAKQSDGAPIV